MAPIAWAHPLLSLDEAWFALLQLVILFKARKVVWIDSNSSEVLWGIDETGMLLFETFIQNDNLRESVINMHSHGASQFANISPEQQHYVFRDEVMIGDTREDDAKRTHEERLQLEMRDGRIVRDFCSANCSISSEHGSLLRWVPKRNPSEPITKNYIARVEQALSWYSNQQ